jgi:hypothetical protein
MARYSILTELVTVPKHVAVAQAETPEEAVRLARQQVQKGTRGVKIGDNELADYLTIEAFAAKHGIR